MDGQLVPVKWDRPGSKYHGMVHYVSKCLVDSLPEDGAGRVGVWWPNRRRGKLWLGTRVDWEGGTTEAVATCTETKQLAPAVATERETPQPPDSAVATATETEQPEPAWWPVPQFTPAHPPAGGLAIGEPFLSPGDMPWLR